MPQCSHVIPVASFCMPLCASTKFVSSSLIGVCDLTGKPSFCAAHCSQRCFSIFFPFLISVRCTVAGLLQLSHFIFAISSWVIVFRADEMVNQPQDFVNRA